MLGFAPLGLVVILFNLTLLGGDKNVVHRRYRSNRHFRNGGSVFFVDVETTLQRQAIILKLSGTK